MRRTLLVLVVLGAACNQPESRPRRNLASDTLPVLVGAGDIADCTRDGREETARILDTIPGTVFVAGDAGYRQRRVPDPLHQCYDPSWGRHRKRTRPTPGNHEYDGGEARAYFGYFGSAAAPPNGYYSYDLGTWHVVALNTAIKVDSASPQVRWLHADLESHVGRCTVAYMHHPRFSSGPHTERERMVPIWTELAYHGVAIAIAGHDHIYERFAPLNASGTPDSLHGVRQFVVGTGGAELYSVEAVLPFSEAHAASDFGVLKLTLLPTRYQWEFIPVKPSGFHDRGESGCQPIHAAL